MQRLNIFEGLRKIREFERQQLSFLRSIVDFDLVIEIGYAQEQGQPLTLKQLLLVDISSRSTVRRQLSRLIDQGIVERRKHASDNRATLLTISAACIKTFGKYGGALSSISALHFN